MVLVCSISLAGLAREVAVSDAGVYPIVAEPHELSLWAVQPSDVADYATNLQTRWYEEFTGVKTHWTTTPSQGRFQQFQTSVLSGEWPDIYLFEFDLGDLKVLVDYEVLLPLDELIEEHTVYIKQALVDSPEIRDAIVNPFDGKIYTLFEDTYNLNSVINRMYVNKNWLEQYETATGKGMPSTTEDFEEMLLFFRDNDMNGNGDVGDEIPYLGSNAWTQGGDGVFYLLGSFAPTSTLNCAFATILNDDGTAYFSANTEEFREGLRYVRRLYEQGLITEETFITDNSQRFSYTSVPRDEVVVGVISSRAIEECIALTNNDSYVDFSDYIAIPPLKGPGGIRTTVAAADNIITRRSGITATCSNPEIAIKWLDYWYSEEGRAWVINGGQEGVQWWWEDGESLNGPARVIKRTDDVELLYNAAWSNSAVAKILKESDFDNMDVSGINTNALLRNELDRRIYEPYVVYHNWPSQWTTDEAIGMEFGEINMNIKDYVGQAYVSFIMGNTDISSDEDWNAYLEGLNAVGLERFLEVVSSVAENRVM